MAEKNVGTEISPIPPAAEESMRRSRRVDLARQGQGTGRVSGKFQGDRYCRQAGQAVTASAAGKVVYSGAGLRGYGKLIIIKHNNTYLAPMPTTANSW